MTLIALVNIYATDAQQNSNPVRLYIVKNIKMRKSIFYGSIYDVRIILLLVYFRSKIGNCQVIKILNKL
jgi:hypothetical protein